MRDVFSFDELRDFFFQGIFQLPIVQFVNITIELPLVTTFTS